MEIGKKRIGSWLLPAAYALLTYVFLNYYSRLSALADFRGLRRLLLLLFKPQKLSVLALFVLLFVYALMRTEGRLGEKLFRFRWPLAGLLLVLLVAANVSGSSLHIWADYLGLDENGVLLGKARGIRSDEWAVLTPFSASQEYNGYQYFTNIIRGTETDVFIVYGQPAWDIAELFRPFHWGYLLLGFSRGLSYFWNARLIALFMVSFEFGRFFTGDRRRLSLVYALMLTLSPFLQWWFAVNGLVEMLVFGQLAVLAMNAYLRAESSRVRFGCALGIAYCGVAYVLTFYPAWMVPLGYVFLAFVLWTAGKNRKLWRFGAKKDGPPLALGAAVLALSLAYIFLKSRDAITLTLNTVYPGQRTGSAPLGWDALWNWGVYFVTPVTEEVAGSNPVEASTVFGFFPLGLLLFAGGSLRRKKADGLSCLLAAASVFFVFFIFFPWPDWLKNVTLLRFSAPGRALPIFLFLQLLLLLRQLALLRASDASPLFRGLLFLALALGLFTGLAVNPVQQGTAELTDNAVASAVRAVVEEDPEALWVVDEGFPIPNFPITQGARTVNSTNVYPVLERWAQFGADEVIYNRYAHISLSFTSDETHLELVGADGFRVYLNVADLALLDADYVFSHWDLSERETGEVSFELLSEVNGFYIYRILD